MHRLTILTTLVFLAGCGGADTQKAAETPEPAASPLASYAGEWMLDALPAIGDDVLVQVRVVATDSRDGWAMVFEHLDEPVGGHHVTVQGDSVSFTVGPYASALRDGIMVTTTSVVHVHGDEMSGRFTAAYTDSDPPVLHGRLRGTRAN